MLMSIGSLDGWRGVRVALVFLVRELTTVQLSTSSLTVSQLIMFPNIQSFVFPGSKLAGVITFQHGFY
jgi:hypothetical protein